MPLVLAMLETQINSNLSLPHICKYSSFNTSICGKAKGFMGGIWILWNDNSIDSEVSAVNNQVVTAIVQNQDKAMCVISVI